MEVSGEEVLIASGHCGGSLEGPLPWSLEVSGEDSMTASGHYVDC
jgi:hypothetical protein